MINIIRADSGPFKGTNFGREFDNKVPKDLQEIIYKDVDSTAKLIVELPNRYSHEKISKVGESLRIWELIGLYYKNIGRWNDSLAIFSELYNHLIYTQLELNTWVHKGMPLVFIRDCYLNLGCPVIAKRYMMLTLCEDSITYKGNIPPTGTGCYFRLVWEHGLSDIEFKKNEKEIFQYAIKHPNESYYPENILQNIDKNWMVEKPSLAESSIYVINTIYATNLLNQLGDKSGRAFEDLADYLLSCMPGCRTSIREKSKSTEYDIVCAIDGIESDFRSEFGRYFVCECKDWRKSAGITAFAKFCRILDSTKSRFGILFSKKGISGEGTTSDAALEQIKVFQDRGMVIIVINEDDVRYVASGGNFITLLRSKYEKVRLDLK